MRNVKKNLDILQTKRYYILETLQYAKVGGDKMREWLRSIRNEKQLTQLEMGQKMGISESYYNLIENGIRQTNMDISTISKLASALEISVTDIIKYEINYKKGA